MSGQCTVPALGYAVPALEGGYVHWAALTLVTMPAAARKARNRNRQRAGWAATKAAAYERAVL